MEQPADDQCCVIVTCAGNAGEDLKNGPCAEIKCGPNARCRHEVFRGEEAETICVCNPGYTGDPDSSRGCSEHLSSPGGISSDLTSRKEGCQVKNGTYNVGQTWNDGCDYTCTCSSKFEILCQPRCKGLPEKVNDKCEIRKDPGDSCCEIMYCPDPEAMDDLKPVPEPFEGCLFKNETYIQGERFYDGCEQQCQCMGFGDMVCLSRCPPTAIPAPGQDCYTLQDASDPCCNITVCDDPVLSPEENVAKESNNKSPRLLDGCSHNGKTYSFEEEFHEGCDQFCVCLEDGEVFCSDIKCPSAFGLDVINPFCLEWDNHDNFVPEPPMCCPPVPKCLSDGSCEYKGEKFINYDNIPSNLTGCDTRCHCENGKVECRAACHEISKTPPGYLPCDPEIAVIAPQEDRPCCDTWACPRLPKEIVIKSVAVEQENSTAVRMKVRVPRVLDGKSGYFKVFFTSGFQ